MLAFRSFRPISLCFIVVIIACLFYIGAFNRSVVLGHTDLRLLFEVQDATTGEPIPGATVHFDRLFQEEGASGPQSEISAVDYQSDENGHVQCILKDVQFTHSTSLFEDDYFVQLSDCRITVSKPRFQKKEMLNFNSVKHVRNITWGQGALQIGIPVQLKPESQATEE